MGQGILSSLFIFTICTQNHDQYRNGMYRDGSMKIYYQCNGISRFPWQYQLPIKKTHSNRITAHDNLKQCQYNELRKI